MSEPTYAQAKQVVAKTFLASGAWCWMQQGDNIQRALDGLCDQDALFSLQFCHQASGSRCTVSVGHAYDQTAGTKLDEEGNELQCCSLLLSVAWDDHRPMVPSIAHDRAMFYAKVARVTRSAQLAVDALGPTWVIVTPAVLVALRDLTGSAVKTAA